MRGLPTRVDACTRREEPSSSLALDIGAHTRPSPPARPFPRTFSVVEQCCATRRGVHPSPVPKSARDRAGLQRAAARLTPSPRVCLQAKLAEEAERYDDMVQNVKALAELNQTLNVEVRGPSRPQMRRAQNLPVERAREERGLEAGARPARACLTTCAPHNPAGAQLVVRRLQERRWCAPCVLARA